jgi:glycosyltransferase involved in cell wall biosynthesis
MSESGRPVEAMRVLELIPTLWVGGAERMATNLTRRLRRSGHVVCVVSMFAPSGTSNERELAAEGIEVHFLGKRHGLDPRMIPRLARVVAAFRPDVVHTHLGVLKYLLPALAGTPCRVVHTLHNVAEREVEGPSRLIQYIAFRSRVVPVAIGDAVAESVRRVYRLPACRIIRNGITVSDFVPDPRAREEVRAALELPQDAPVFLAVGRLEAQKDHATALRAFASKRLRAANAHLVLAGDGPLRAETERHARALDIADRVRFLGVRSDVPRLLAAADAFVLASRWEGNPLAVMEAMAAGRAVVATRVGCVPELVPESAGRLVAPGDPVALECAVFGLARDRELVRRLGTAAAEIAQARFDVSGMTRAYEALYAEVA